MQCSPHALRTLEFDKIRDQIAERTASPLGKREIDRLAPTDDLELIEITVPGDFGTAEVEAPPAG